VHKRPADGDEALLSAGSKENQKPSKLPAPMGSFRSINRNLYDVDQYLFSELMRRLMLQQKAIKTCNRILA